MGIKFWRIVSTCCGLGSQITGDSLITDTNYRMQCIFPESICFMEFLEMLAWNLSRERSIYLREDPPLK